MWPEGWDAACGSPMQGRRRWNSAGAQGGVQAGLSSSISVIARRSLTRACSRQAGVGRSSARARCSPWPSSGSVSLCGRGPEGLQLMRNPLGSRFEIR